MADITCPECNGETTEVSSNLTELGYIAEDITNQCVECGHHFARGEPVGEFEHEIVEDVECGVCGDYGFLYQMHEGAAKDLCLRFKCPTCFYVWARERDFDKHGNLNIGYPFLMGDITDGWGISGGE